MDLFVSGKTMMDIKRLMIAAPASGSGKTLITCSLLGALKNRGLKIHSFKCGPDYIDPMFHRQVLDIPAENLDTWFLEDEKLKKLFCDQAEGADIAVIEGVMGLFDGAGGIMEQGSSYDVARALDIPIVLVINTRGMGRSVIPLIKGFLGEDRACLIKGIILNRTSEGFYKILKAAIDEELQAEGHDCRVVGYFPDNKELNIESRHLGLVIPEDMGHVKEMLAAGARQFEACIDMGSLMEIAENAKTIDCPADTELQNITPKVTLAVARDEAFCFYYDANIRLMQKLGAKIEYFSPLYDKELPKDADGILLGGGYPELHCGELSNNKTMIESLQSAHKKGMPILAECGGFMYLHRELEDKDGHVWPMAGLVDAGAYYAGRSVRFGYIELFEKDSIFLPAGEGIKGHEFHYWESRDNGSSCVAKKPFSGRNWECVSEKSNCFWGFPHLYYLSNPSFAEHFIAEMLRFSQTS